MDICWIVSFTLRNIRLHQPFSFDGMEFENHPRSSKDSPKARVTNRFATPINYPSDRISSEAREKIERFLACANVNLALTGYDVREPVEELDVEIENRRELIKAGVSPPTKFSVDIRTTSTYTKDFALTAWRWMDKLAKEKDAEVLFRILCLLRQSMVEDDDYDRLFKVWRAFNAFYNHRTSNPGQPEPDRIKEFARSLSSAASDSRSPLASIIQEYWTPLRMPVELEDKLTYVLTTRSWSSVMDCFIKQIVSRGATNHSANLANAIAAQNVIGALESALLCVYEERCKVMHGEIFSEDEHDLLYVCTLFLQRIVALALNEFYFIPLKQAQP